MPEYPSGAGFLADLALGEKHLPGPPWILGQRGSPFVAPENTLAGFREALDAGLDGFLCNLRASLDGEPVVLADERLERTTSGQGAVADWSLPQLFGLDAGGGFARRFAGESVPHFDEVLELEHSSGGTPRRLVFVHDASLVEELARGFFQRQEALAPRYLSRSREVSEALALAGLPAGLVIGVANFDDLAWARDLGLDFVASEGPAGWRTEAGRAEWPCERWALGLDGPKEICAALAGGLAGFSTREPQRALALRTLAQWVSAESGTPPLKQSPLETSALEVFGAGDPAGGPDWSGRWDVAVLVRNPLAEVARVACRVLVRRGAFEVQGMPQTLELAPGEEQRVHLQLSGGSWSPGGDPVFAALFDWGSGGQSAGAHGRLLFDVPLRRLRRTHVGVLTQRLDMLRESPDDPPASMTVRRQGQRLTVAVENSGGLSEVEILVRLEDRHFVGNNRVQLKLPEDFDARPAGLDFCCGFRGRKQGGAAFVLRRWGGGLPREGDHGVPGRLQSS
jgi:hypothetical protein